MTDVADDDLLLNTGVSFPIAFRRANVYGAEAKIESAASGSELFGFIGYSLMHGIGDLPVTGGLFLGEEDTEQLESTEQFPLTQDQRHTVRGRATLSVLAVSLGGDGAGSYGSGLPFEDFDGTPEDAAEQFGQRVVDRVNFETGRVRPTRRWTCRRGITLPKSARHARSAAGRSPQPDQPLRRDQFRRAVLRAPHSPRRGALRCGCDLITEAAAVRSSRLAIRLRHFFSTTTTPHGLPPVETFFSTLPLATSTMETSPLGPLAV